MLMKESNLNDNQKKYKKMKKYFNLLILAMLPMCFAACSSDNDVDSSGVDASIEGIWRIKSVKWSYYTKGGSIESTDEIEEYDETTTRGLSITKNDGKFYITSTAPGIIGNYEQVGGNEFRGVGGGDDIYQRLVIVGVNGDILTAEFYEDYYENSDGQRDEYGLLTFIRQ